MSSTLLAQSLILTLDLMVTSLLWLHYRNLRRSYLALGAIAGMLECARQLFDTLSIVAPDAVVAFHFSTSLQFLSSLVLVGALLRARDDSRRITLVCAPLALLFGSIYVAQQVTGFERTIPEWYLLYLPLMLTQGAIVWHAWRISPQWPLSRIMLLMTAAPLLVIRILMPAYLHTPPDILFYTLYLLESLICPIMLGGLVLSAMEEGHRRVQSLLVDRAHAAEDLQSSSIIRWTSS